MPDPNAEDNSTGASNAGGANNSKKKSAEKYFKVIFNAKTAENDPEDVMLGVNGELLNIKRETEVVLPQRFLEVADHASETKWKQLPGQPRKKVGVVKRYPYTVLGPAKKEDYLKAKAEGTKATLDAAQRNLDGSRNVG